MVLADIKYAGEETLDVLSKLVKQAIAEAVTPDPDQPIEFGTDKHDELKNRDLPDQHPIAAITGLTEVLTGIETNAHAINTLREQNNIEHNTMKASIQQAVDYAASAVATVGQLTETVSALNDAVDAVEERQDGVDERLGDYKLQFNTAVRDLSAADEAQKALIQGNANAIKALQDAGSSGGSTDVAEGTIYVAEWLENGDPPTVGTAVTIGFSNFVGAKPKHNDIYYAVIRRGDDVYFCSVRYKLTGETSSITPTSVIKMGGNDTPIATDVNPTFVGWATTFVSGSSEPFEVQYSRVNRKPNTGDQGMVIAWGLSDDGVYMVYGLCSGETSETTFAMQASAEIRVDRNGLENPTFGNLILNVEFEDPPIIGKGYALSGGALNRIPNETTPVAGIIRHGNAAFYIEGNVEPPHDDISSVASFTKIVKLTSNLLTFYDDWVGPPDVGTSYGMEENRFSRRPITDETARGVINYDNSLYFCVGKVTYNPDVLPQYKPNPSIIFSYVSKITAPETIAWDKITGKPDFSSIYRYKGSVATVDDLSDTAEIGDVYNVVATGMNFAWTGEEWDALGGTVDLTEVNSSIVQLQTDVANLNNSSTTQQTAINGLTERTTKLESDVTGLNNVTASVDNSLKEIKTDIDTNKTAIGQAVERIGALEYNKNLHEARLTAAESNITTLTNAVAQNGSDIDVLVNHVTELIQRVPTKVVTKAEYDALTNTEKSSETLWVVMDGDSGSFFYKGIQLGGSSAEVVNPPLDYSDVTTVMNPAVLKADAWADNKQTVTVTGIVATEAYQLIQPCPAASSQSMYYASGVSCISQATDSLTFQATTVPTEDLTVYIAVINVQGVTGENGNLPTLTDQWSDVGMTSDTAPSPMIVSYGGGVLMTAGTAYKVFQSTSGIAEGTVFSTYTPGELYVQIYLGGIRSAGGVRVYTRRTSSGLIRNTAMFKAFSIFGSNNGVNWTKIKSFNGLTEDAWNTTTPIPFMFDFITSFSYYRFIYDEGLSTASLTTGVIEFYI